MEERQWRSGSGWPWTYGTADWNHAHIDNKSQLFVWDGNAPDGKKWERINAPPGTTIDELKALGALLARMNN